MVSHHTHLCDSAARIQRYRETECGLREIDDGPREKTTRGAGGTTSTSLALALALTGGLAVGLTTRDNYPLPTTRNHGRLGNDAPP